MHFLYPLLVVVGTISSANAVSCWKSGLKVSVDDIAPKIVEICDEFESTGYDPGEEHYKCVNDLAGVKWEFALTFIGHKQKARGIRSVECQSGMTKQIGCECGGETSYVNWRYRADPNNGGRCVDLMYGT